jgi:proteasome assembly chaperone (PAC2) family protein
MKFHHPWFIAVWPGMGNIAMTAGYYLMAKLEMHLHAEFSPRELFEFEHVEVKDGLIQTASLPSSRLFVWVDPAKQHDIILFIGEAQPPRGKYAFCRRLIEYARQLEVERVFTFAAMATAMHPTHPSRVFGAATDEVNLAELKRLELEILNDGQISGLNGLLLGVAKEMGVPGACLLGEMPHVLSQMTYPKGALAVLEAFLTMAKLDIDVEEIKQQSANFDEQLGKFLARLERSMGGEAVEEVEEEGQMERPAESRLSFHDRHRIEELFHQSKSDRSKAYELKNELDKLQIFPEYEERFLDLFKRVED